MADIQYFTVEGLKKFKEELHHLKTAERKSISQQISEARDKGDLSENAEYDAAKEAQGLMEARIANLVSNLSNARLVDETKIDTSRVLILSTVKLRNKKNKAEMKYTLVAENEADFKSNKISVSSPIGKGLLGKKVGEGFYTYQDGKAIVAPDQAVPEVKEFPPVWVSPRASRRLELLQLLKDLGATIETGASPSPHALTLVAPLGFDVTTVAVVERLDPARTIGIDMLFDDAATKRRVLATNPATRSDMRDAAHALFAKDGKAVSVVRDSGGFITQRVVANIVNIASDMCQQGVCTPQDLDLAVTLGLGYPLGPLALGDKLGPTNVLEVLFNLQTVYGDPRYRPSPWLRRRGAIGLSLLHTED